MRLLSHALQGKVYRIQMPYIVLEYLLLCFAEPQNHMRLPLVSDSLDYGFIESR